MRQKTHDSGEAVTQVTPGCSSKRPGNIFPLQHVFIFDLDGFSLTTATHRPTLDILQRLIAVYEGIISTSITD